MQSSNVAFQYGVSGPFWYAAGATVQVLLFGILAIEVKRKAPTCHTVLEIIRARWGTVAHLVFLFFCLLTNIIVTAMLLLGGAAVVNALTGVDIDLAAFLIPIGIILYTAAGGLKATFLASYIHTTIIFIALLIFIFQIYATHKDLGSPYKVYDNLKIKESVDPVVDNQAGSYLTMLSKGGLIFGIINIVGNFGTVFVDQSYWQSAIAAKPSSTYKGYILGGLVWFAVPFSLATSLGLGALALDLPLSSKEAGAGLVPPATASHLMGEGGAFLILLMLFMAVTSTGSAELIAVSSLFSYDVFKTYFKPNATGKEIILCSRITCVVWGLVMGVFAIILQRIGLDLGWVYLAMGVLIGSAVIPIAMCLVWNKCSAKGAIAGALLGQVLGVITWIVAAIIDTGEVTVDSLGNQYPMLAGNLVSILSSGFICTVISIMKPQLTDWSETKKIDMLEEDPNAHLAKQGEDSLEAMNQAFTWTVKYGSLGTFVLIVVWPLLSLPAMEFSKGYFTFWVLLSILWGLVGTITIIFLPIYEAKEGLMTVISNMMAGKSAEPVALPTRQDDSAQGGGHFMEVKKLPY